MRGFLILTIGVALFCSCETASESAADSLEEESFQELVEMHCRARILKNERFALAEEMRNRPDSMANYDSIRTAKSSMSRALSDSIREKLGELSAKLSVEEKRAFNEKVEAEIKKLDCE